MIINKKYGNKVLASYVLTAWTANCHKIDINLTSLQGVARKDSVVAAM